MPSPKILDLLNRQVGVESYAASVYRSAAATAYALGLDVTARWLRSEAGDERGHADAFACHVEERGGDLRIPAVEAPPVAADQHGLAAVLVATESRTTAALVELLTAAESEGDRLTAEFVRGHVLAQVGEEAKVRQFARWVAGSSDLASLDQQVASAAAIPRAE